MLTESTAALFPRTVAALAARAGASPMAAGSAQAESPSASKRAAAGADDRASAQARVEELAAELDELMATFDRQQAHEEALQEAIDSLAALPVAELDVLPKAIDALQTVHAEAMMQLERTGTRIAQTDTALKEYESAVASFDETDA